VSDWGEWEIVFYAKFMDPAYAEKEFFRGRTLAEFFMDYGLNEGAAMDAEALARHVSIKHGLDIWSCRYGLFMSLMREASERDEPIQFWCPSGEDGSELSARLWVRDNTVGRIQGPL